MSERENETDIRDWLAAREPGTVPDRLRAAAGRVPFEVRRPLLAGLGEGLAGWTAAFGSFRRAGALIMVLALLAALAAILVIVGSRPHLARNGMVAFVGDAAEGGADIYVVQPDGSGLRQLTTTAVDEYAPAWSPDGTRLAFLRGDPEAADAVVVIVEVASGDEVLAARLPSALATVDNAANRHLRWSPDGSLVMANQSFGSAALDVGQGRWTLISAGVGPALWSPDGRWLLIASSDLFVVPANAVGGGPITDPSTVAGARNLTGGATDGPWFYVSPMWSPDSTAIAFTSFADYPCPSQDCQGRMDVVTVAGAERRILAEGGFGVAWSPDGASIAYLVEAPCSRIAGCGAEAWTIAVDGTHPQRIASSFHAPRWSPDGTLLYLYDEAGLVAISVDGTSVTRLSPVRFQPSLDDISSLNALELVDDFSDLGGADWQGVQP